MSSTQFKSFGLFPHCLRSSCCVFQDCARWSRALICSRCWLHHCVTTLDIPEITTLSRSTLALSLVRCDVPWLSPAWIQRALSCVFLYHARNRMLLLVMSQVEYPYSCSDTVGKHIDYVKKGTTVLSACPIVCTNLRVWFCFCEFSPSIQRPLSPWELPCIRNVSFAARRGHLSKLFDCWSETGSSCWVYLVTKCVAFTLMQWKPGNFSSGTLGNSLLLQCRCIWVQYCSLFKISWAIDGTRPFEVLLTEELIVKPG